MNRPDGVWDEFDWELYLRVQDKKLERLMELVFRPQNKSEYDEIFVNEFRFLWRSDQSDFEWTDWLEGEDALSDEGENWKDRVEHNEAESADSELGLGHPVNRMTQEFVQTGFRLIESLPESKRENTAVVDFISNVLDTSANVADGTSSEFGIAELGASIAYCKRGLSAANEAIAALRDMREEIFLPPKVYLETAGELTELRDAIALLIQQLREQFNSGVLM